VKGVGGGGEDGGVWCSEQSNPEAKNVAEKSDNKPCEDLRGGNRTTGGVTKKKRAVINGRNRKLRWPSPGLETERGGGKF